jgi:uncharacterized protein (DUF488 family)
VSGAATFWTVGHSTRSIEDFVALLKHYQLDGVIDVRRHPGSRRLPQFGSEALREQLAEAGLDYLWLEALGGRRRAAKNSPNGAWRNASFRGYADYLDDPAFEQGLQQALEFSRGRRCTLMCAEVLWWRCHRSLIADVLKLRGFEVLHIRDENHLDSHPFTTPARLLDGRLSYSPELGEPLKPPRGSG